MASEIHIHPDGQWLIVGAVADGMGGLSHATEASRCVADLIVREIIACTTLTPTILRDLFGKVNALLLRRYGGASGTTLTVAVLQNSGVLIGHVGDSRALFKSQTSISWSTPDHSRLAEEIQLENPLPDLVRTSPLARRLTHSLGDPQFLPSWVFTREYTCVMPGDCVILVTDGVWTECTPVELAEIADALPPESAAMASVKLAMQRDDADDCSCVVLQVA
ncbi:MAG: protein phosphatase 2C domain-containing protein [Planctomycetes bacterium]|nr:protein phosphatase 2C domain-containing protein [Planctomycetota bacterium]